MSELPFHRKYRPSKLSEYIGNDKLKESIKNTLRNGNKPQVMLFYGDSGCGKAQPLDSHVLTVEGYKRMGDIMVGDEVFTHSGNRGIVSGIYPQGIRPIYRITLSDKTYIDVSDEHLNCVYVVGAENKRKEYVLTTKDLIHMFDGGCELRVDIPSVEWEYQSVNLSSSGVGDLINSETGIPKKYLYNTGFVRVHLLYELLEGYAVPLDSGVFEFMTESEKFSNDLSFLVRSLGLMDTVVQEGVCYKHIIKESSDTVFRVIESIEYIGDQECQCIMIDHPDHTYISDFFIPTHNTTIARLIAKEYLCTERDDENGACGVCYNCQIVDDYIHTGDTSNLTSIKEIDIASEGGKRDLDAVVEDMMIPSFEWKIYILDECHEATSGAQNRLLKIVEEPPENVLIIFCTTNPEKMLDTLRNRCQIQLRVAKPTVKELAGLSRRICTIEDVEYDMKGLEFIANRAECTIRSNLQLLQRVINEQGKADYVSATNIFEEVSNVMIIKFFKALKSHNVLGYVTLLHKIKITTGLETFMLELEQFVKKGIYVINGIEIDGVSDGDLVSYRELFGDLGVAKVSFLLNKLTSISKGNIEMELLLWGYTGLDNPVVSDSASVLESIQSLPDECAKENAQANKVIKEEEQIKTQNGIKNADSLVQEVDIDLLLQMGGILVDD